MTIGRTVARRRSTLRRIDPWSVLKFGFVLNLAVMIIMLLGAATVWFVIERVGLIDRACSIALDLGFTDCGVNGGNLFRALAVLGLLSAVVATGLMVFGAFLHNLIADLVGGLTFTFHEEGAPRPAGRTRGVEAASTVAMRPADTPSPAVAGAPRQEEVVIRAAGVPRPDPVPRARPTVPPVPPSRTPWTATRPGTPPGPTGTPPGPDHAPPTPAVRPPAASPPTPGAPSPGGRAPTPSPAPPTPPAGTSTRRPAPPPPDAVPPRVTPPPGGGATSPATEGPTTAAPSAPAPGPLFAGRPAPPSPEEDDADRSG